MNEFLINVLLALGLASSPPPTSSFQAIGSSDKFEIEIDTSSISPKLMPGGWEVKSTIRLRAIVEFDVQGKRKKGSYYIDEVTAVCKDEVLIVNSAMLYSKDGEILAAGKNVASFDGKTSAGNFIGTFLNTMCNDPTIVKPGTMI